jgi:hypothetical protein
MRRPDLDHLYASFGLLLGRWEGQEVISASPRRPAGVASGRHSVRLALDGTAAIQDYVRLCVGQPAFSGHGIYTLDPACGEVLCSPSTRMGFRRWSRRAGGGMAMCCVW